LSLLEPEPAQGRAAVLVIGVGNPARGDDAIGPLLLERLRAEFARGGAGDTSAIELLDVYQLQPEHALDLRGRRRVIVVDAAAGGPVPYAHGLVSPDPTHAFSTHSLSPAALAAVYQRLYGVAPPLETLAVRGECFGLGESLGNAAAANLDAALAWLRADLDRGVVPIRARCQ
jgi:hydrogenase maturation protease